MTNHSYILMMDDDNARAQKRLALLALAGYRVTHVTHIVGEFLHYVLERPLTEEEAAEALREVEAAAGGGEG